jgi:hypothetical protein
MPSYFLRDIDADLLRDMKVSAAIQGVTTKEYILTKLRQNTPRQPLARRAEAQPAGKDGAK